jgi:NAD(P)-dependent dehydrogenase (short-subunit alcohol dehydrogenase family)
MSVQSAVREAVGARDLDRRVAVVTGGARGIGRGIVDALSARGADVVVADLDPGTGDEEAVRVDVTDERSVRDLVQVVIERHGRLDILVNSAGVSRSLPFVDIEEAEWDRVFDVNVKGVYLACRAVVPHMMQRRSGRS